MTVQCKRAVEINHRKEGSEIKEKTDMWLEERRSEVLIAVLPWLRSSVFFWLSQRERAPAA